MNEHNSPSCAGNFYTTLMMSQINYLFFQKKKNQPHSPSTPSASTARCLPTRRTAPPSSPPPSARERTRVSWIKLRVLETYCTVVYKGPWVIKFRNFFVGFENADVVIPLPFNFHTFSLYIHESFTEKVFGVDRQLRNWCKGDKSDDIFFDISY